MQALAVTVVSALINADVKPPEDEDVVAGWLGFAVFVFLAVAVALLGWSLTRQLRKAERAQRAGAFGDVPVEETSGADDAGEQGTQR